MTRPVGHDPLLAYARHLTRDDDEAAALVREVRAARPAASADEAALRRQLFERWRTWPRPTGRGPEPAHRSLVDRALREMPVVARETWMLYVEGLTPTEIAARLDLPAAAVGARLGRAREYLARELAPLL